MILLDNFKWFFNFNENVINKFENIRDINMIKKMLFMFLKIYKGYYILFYFKYQVFIIQILLGLYLESLCCYKKQILYFCVY